MSGVLSSCEIDGFSNVLDEAPDLDEAEREDLITIVHQQSVYMARIVDDLVMTDEQDKETSVLMERVEDGKGVFSYRFRSVDDSFDYRTQGFATRRTASSSGSEFRRCPPPRCTPPVARHAIRPRC